MSNSMRYFIEANKTPVIGIVAFASFIFLTKRYYFSGGRFNDTKTKLTGKTVIITGANTGIGKETALDMARRDARVILACRDLTRANKAAEEIRKQTGNGNVLVESLDLASFESIRKFSTRINSQEERIDILINNAGIMACPQWKTKDGFEMQFGVNHLGHFLLTNLLLDKIKKSSPSRIVNVSSRAYEKGKMNWDDLNNEKDYDPRRVYNQSKLSNVLFTRELAKKLEGTNVTVNALHPGVVRTELGRHFSDSYGWKATAFQLIFFPIIFWVFKSCEQGAQTNIYCACSPDLRTVTGKYFSDCKEKELLPHALSDEDAKNLWYVSEKLVKL